MRVGSLEVDVAHADVQLAQAEALAKVRDVQAQLLVMPLELATDIDASPALCVIGPEERKQRCVVEEVTEDGSSPVENDQSVLVGAQVVVEQVVVHEIPP